MDEAGNKIQFKPNWAQRSLLDNLWFLNIVLKARQLGFTTVIDILALDTALFYPNVVVEIIAHNREDAQKIFERKVLFAWNNLPDWLKQAYTVNTETKNSLKFSNESSISVSTSSRSGTVQYLHVSELGVMSQKYPEKAREVMSGSLNAVHPGQIVIIESTAKGRDGFFYDMCQIAMKNKQAGKKLTKMDYKFHFFPWWRDPRYILEDQVPITKEYSDYFAQLAQRGIELSDEQKWWYIKKAEIQGDEMKSEYPSYPEEAFEASIEGAYYAKHMLQARKDGRLTIVPWEPKINVDTWWDLGMNDSMSIVFTQTVGSQVRIIDYYEHSGEGFAHYRKVLSDKPYTYGRHTFPFDIEVKELGTGKSRKEVLIDMGFTVDVAPKLDPNDGIEAVRNMFSSFWIDELKCKRLIDCLDNYRKEWDDKLGTWKNRPLHDQYSHGADAMRVLATAYNPSLLTTAISEHKETDFDKYGLFGV